MMTMETKAQQLIASVEALLSNPQASKSAALPSETYFLNADEIVCLKRRFGDARYPYSADGLTLWAYSSGNVKIEEGRFNVILNFTEGKEPNLCFYTGEKRGERYFPISLTGAGKLPFEEGVTRYTVFTPDAAYYITRAAAFNACVRMFTDEKKNVCFTLWLKNESEQPLETYLASYFNCMLSHASYEYIETKWYRQSRTTPRGFALGVTEYVDRTTCFTHRAEILRDSAKQPYSTTSHTDFCGGMHNQVCCSTALQNARFEENKSYTEFTDTAIAGDLLPLTLCGGESYTMSYVLSTSEQPVQDYTTARLDEMLYAEKSKEAVGANIPPVRFAGEWQGLQGELLEKFLKNVFRQTEFCARAKNYAGPLIGIRDIFQQLEAALVWIPDYCRGKILEALNHIGEDGRAPRQYSYSSNKDVVPAMDLRPYIDQGVWVISTVYTYLSQTGDFTMLDEECGYYKLYADKVEFSDQRDSVLAHLVRIVEYLISNLDETTGCLRALYGDWNDALDGLGKTEDTGKAYGSGVSVMASLQLYRNLWELEEILQRLNKPNEACRYASIRKTLGENLLRYAIVKEGEERKVLHGWGDKRSYTVGGFCDNDGENRDSLTSNAFWVLSRMIDTDESLKKDILAAYARLDSTYGIKTFNPYFSQENKQVGRITRLPKGTAENGAVYIHATLFAIMSLFEMGEAEEAWRQMYKILPTTHSFISTTPFVMPNSYVENLERGFNGESMSDWFTGSGCVLVKILLWYALGIRADLNGVTITPARYIPFEEIKITLPLKGNRVTLCVRKGAGERQCTVNGEKVESVFVEKLQATGVRFENGALANGALIEIVG